MPEVGIEEVFPETLVIWSPVLREVEEENI
jgi:hypothetical protein